MIAADFVARLPAHKAGLHIEHQPHLANYETVAEWCESSRYAQWVSDEEKTKAIDSGEVWVLQWYPHTPIGFNAIAASTLEALLVECDAMKAAP